MSAKPAWQRLGLKLKSANGTSGVGQRNADTQVDRQALATAASTTKRKLEQNPSSLANTTSASPHIQNGFKKARRDDPAPSPTRPPAHLKKQKSVTFGDTPAKNDGQRNKITPARPNRENASQPSPKQSKSKAKGPAKKEKKQTLPSTDLKPALEYLRQWGNSRDTWKFNKNHQSSLINKVFDITDDGIPAADIDIFYQYIRDLKGFVRMRLREMALEIRTKDEADGVKAWPENMTSLEGKQRRYESLVSEYWTSPQARKRKSFSETDFLANSDDDDPIIRRVVKRLRAEMVFMELSDGEETDVSTTSTQSSRTMTNGDAAPTPMNIDDGKKVKLNDGPAKRKRKLRTGAGSDDSSSSSESESDSDSDTSSSGSSSDESDSDDEMEDDRGYESSSSSSSSSSGEDESGSESDDEEEL